MAQIKTIIFTTVGNYVYKLPDDFESLYAARAIGGGEAGNTGVDFLDGGNGGGYAFVVEALLDKKPVAGDLMYYNVGAGGSGSNGANGTSSWVNFVDNVSPSSSTVGCRGRGGGSGDLNVPSATFYFNSGGAGGGGNDGAGGGGGGGAGGPDGAGGSGNDQDGVAAGGGGGANGSSGGTGKNGDPGGGPSGDIAGSGGLGAISSPATAATAGTQGGGGGAGIDTVGLRNGAAGGDGFASFTDSITGITAGGGGGGGGAMGSGVAGNGGLYGGGGGGGGTRGNGAQGVVILQYYVRGDRKTKYKFPIKNADGTSSSTFVDMEDMFVHKNTILQNGLYTWGSGTNGALGLGDTVDRSSPVQVGTLSNWRLISESMAIKNDGTLWAWGGGANGPLGDGTTAAKSSPIQVGAANDWVYAMRVNDSVHAIKQNGTLWAWGNNNIGQLGLGTTVNRSSPVQVGTMTHWRTAIVQNSTDLKFGLGLSTDGEMYQWGNLTYAGPYEYVFPTAAWMPTQIGELTGWDEISASDTASSAAIRDGALYMWGENGLGELGLGNTVDRSSPVQVGTLTSWSKVSTNAYHTLAVRTDGTLWAWGNNTVGQLGLGTTVNRSSPVQVGTMTNWSNVFASNNRADLGAGDIHSSSFAIKTDGTLWAWGINDAGQLGLGDLTTRSSPVQVGTLNTWKMVAASSQHTIGVTTDGALYAWGDGGSGRLGFYTAFGVSTPVRVGSLNNWSLVATGRSHSMAIKTDNTLWAFGANGGGQLGLNNGTTNVSSPVQVGTLSDWARVACNDTSTTAVKTDGTLWGWGEIEEVQVWGDVSFFPGGNGTEIESPVQVGTGNNWNLVSSGGYFGSGSGLVQGVRLLTKTDGSLWSNGFTTSGALGYEYFPSSVLSPIQIGTTTTWRHICSGGAIDTSGNLYTWGRNGSGQLGQGDTYARAAPTKVGNDSTWRMVSSSIDESLGDYFVAIKQDGTLWSWGSGVSGRLGLGTTTNRSVPTQVGILNNWKSVSCRERSVLAVKTDGTIWTWGQGNNGVLGQGDTVSRSSPVQLGNLNGWLASGIGPNSYGAILSRDDVY